MTVTLVALMGWAWIWPDVRKGFVAGLEIARTSRTYRPVSIPPPLDDGLGAFCVPVPAGFRLAASGTMVVVSREDDPFAGVLVRPVLAGPLTPLVEVHESVAGSVDRALRRDGGHMERRQTRDLGTRVLSTIRLRCGGEDLTGELWTLRKGRHACVVAIFARRLVWDRDRVRFAAILEGFELRVPGPLAERSEGPASFALPEGWKLSPAGPRRLVARSPDPTVRMVFRDDPMPAGKATLETALVSLLQDDPELTGLEILETHRPPPAVLTGGTRRHMLWIEGTRLAGRRAVSLTLSLRLPTGRRVALWSEAPTPVRSRWAHALSRLTSLVRLKDQGGGPGSFIPVSPSSLHPLLLLDAPPPPGGWITPADPVPLLQCWSRLEDPGTGRVLWLHRLAARADGVYLAPGRAGEVLVPARADRADRTGPGHHGG